MKSYYYHNNDSKKMSQQISKLLLNILFLSLFYWIPTRSQAGRPLIAVTDQVCTSKYCQPSNPCNCSAGVTITGGVAPYQIIVFPQGGSTPVGFTACVNGLCPGSYDIRVFDSNVDNVKVTIDG